MLLSIHIASALLSLGLTTVSTLSPSSRALKACLVLIGATVSTGIALVLTTHAPIVASCLMGIAYITVISALMITAHHRIRV